MDLIICSIFMFISGISATLSAICVIKNIIKRRNDVTDDNYVWFCNLPRDSISDEEALIFLERYLCERSDAIHDIYKNRRGHLNYYIVDDILTIHSKKYHNELRINAKRSKKK